ncbi:MAG: hypothetical protein ACT4OM_06870 [Actinomycetota bacterium]
MSSIDWYEVTGNPTPAESALLVAALEQWLAEGEVANSPRSNWVRAMLPGLPSPPPGSHPRVWRRPTTRKVAAAIGGLGGVAASVALAIKLRQHQQSQHPPAESEQPEQPAPTGGDQPAS